MTMCITAFLERYIRRYVSVKDCIQFTISVARDADDIKTALLWHMDSQCVAGCHCGENARTAEKPKCNKAIVCWCLLCTAVNDTYIIP